MSDDVSLHKRSY